MNLLFPKLGLSLTMLGFLAVAGLCLTSCQGPQPDYRFLEAGVDGGHVAVDPTVSDPTLSPGPGPSPDTLRTGDRITIVFSGNPNAPQMPHQEQIREDGYITPPLLGTHIMAAGKTIGQLQRDLHALYVPAFFQTLTITVRSEERFFSVGGQVNRPGQFLYRSDMTVLKAIQVAGDFTDFANRRRVLLTRKDGTLIEVDTRRALRDVRYDPAVYPGDLIHVPQRW